MKLNCLLLGEQHQLGSFAGVATSRKDIENPNFRIKSQRLFDLISRGSNGQLIRVGNPEWNIRVKAGLMRLRKASNRDAKARSSEH